MRITAAPVRSPVRTRPLRPRLRQRRAALLGVLLLLPLVGASFLLVSALTHPAHAQPNQAGADDARMQAAVLSAQWPQRNGVWCGVSDIAAIANYEGTATTQDAVVAYLNSAPAVSAWGTPGHNYNVAYGPGFAADISRDMGTDPRSMAAGLAGMAGGGYHQWVDYHSAYNATAHLIADLVRTQQPITAFVNAASHSVLVSAVRYYGSDPTNLNNVTELEIWDSGSGTGAGVQPYQDEWVSLNTWLTHFSYYGSPYHANIYDGRHALDPDPSVGPYTYDPSQGRSAHLWIGHYVYIHPDSAGEPARGVSPDWAFNQDGALIRGLNGELPAGYGGPSVPLYIPPPPAPRPQPTATATPLPTKTPPGPRPTEPELVFTPGVSSSPTPTSGSLFGFSLQSVCLGGACGSPEAVSAITLGGASSLGATLLVLVGVVTVRRRKRKRRAVTAAATKATQPPSAATTGAAEASHVATAEASGEAESAPADTPGLPDATAQEEPDAPAVSTETGPLARLARTSERLERLAAETPAAVAAASGAAPSAAEAEAPAETTPTFTNGEETTSAEG